MAFETSKEVLDWYEKEERTLTDEFIDNLPWQEVRDTPLDAPALRAALRASMGQ